MLAGVGVYKLKRNVDDRGFFSEILRSDWKDFLQGDEIRQVNISVSNPGVIRAWHCHNRGQIDYITLIKGSIKLSIYDGRGDSQTKGQLKEFILSDNDPKIIRVPGFYWHGTKCIGEEPSSVLYCMSKLYDYLSPDEERKAWDDSSIIDPKTNKPYKW